MRKYLSLLTLLFCSIALSVAQDIVQPMVPTRTVNDYAGLFSASQQSALNDTLTAFKKATSNEIAVVVVNDLGAYDVSEYALKVAREWGVGGAEKNNGVVLLIKPRNDNGAGKVYIAVGYGLEGVLPDGLCGRIIDNDMMPYLKAGDYYQAAVAGTTAIREVIKGEYKGDTTDDTGFNFGFIILIAVVIFAIFIMASRKKGDGTDDNNGSGRGWIPPIIIGGLGGFGSGRSSGGGGGGFGGFGGGGFGGGGAGRSF